MGSLCLCVPKGLQDGLDIPLVNVFYRHLAELWQTMKLKRGEPSARFPIALQVSLAGFKRSLRDILQTTVGLAASSD